MSESAKQKPAARAAESGTVAGINAARTDAAGMLGWFGAAMMEHVTRCGAEFAEFVSLRLNEDVKTQHELLNCRDLERLSDIQARFFKTAMEQYTEETGRMVQLGNELMQAAQKRGRN